MPQVSISRLTFSIASMNAVHNLRCGRWMHLQRDHSSRIASSGDLCDIERAPHSIEREFLRVIMSSQRPPDRVVHQDYIAKIRFSNQLPPPPNPPKLLDIPGTGLSGGQYTSAGYASRLAREQPLNIEADAELGMPINLVGIPGVFDGDERGRDW